MNPLIPVLLCTLASPHSYVCDKQSIGKENFHFNEKGLMSFDKVSYYFDDEINLRSGCLISSSNAGTGKINHRVTEMSCKELLKRLFKL